MEREEVSVKEDRGRFCILDGRRYIKKQRGRRTEYNW